MKNINKISVVSSDHYKDLIAEVKLGSIAGFIISKEPNDINYMISVHSFLENSAESFDYNLNIDSQKMPLQLLLAALDEAKRRLDDLG